MRKGRSLPLLVAGGAGLLVIVLAVVQSGPPAAPMGGGTGPTRTEIAYATDTPSAIASALSSASSTAVPSDSSAPDSAATPAPTARTVQTTATPARTLSPIVTVAPTAPTPVPPTPTPTAVAGSCGIFPRSNVWNVDISRLPAASNSAAMINAIGRGDYLHPDFDAIGDGIPYNVVTSSTPRYNVTFEYADESDPGPYPIPANPRIEKGSDKHMLMIDVAACRLWELYAVHKSGSGWSAGSGATWDLRSNALRPAGWTSADAAGLPILPGLVRYEEVHAGVIRHAIRFTASDTCGYIYPARHQTANPCSNLPPMGLRVRLKAAVDISGFGPQARVVLTALKRYGMILADNGAPWYITGVPDTRWNDDELHHLQDLTGADFEVVNTSSLRNG